MDDNDIKNSLCDRRIQDWSQSNALEQDINISDYKLTLMLSHKFMKIVDNNILV